MTEPGNGFAITFTAEGVVSQGTAPDAPTSEKEED